MRQCSEFSNNEESQEQMINQVNPASSNRNANESSMSNDKSVEMIELAGEQLGSGQYTFLDDDQQQNANNRINFGGQRVNDIEPIDFSLI